MLLRSLSPSIQVSERKKKELSTGGKQSAIQTRQKSIIQPVWLNVIYVAKHETTELASKTNSSPVS